ncbi:BnaC01g32540D [Brassica napus]|uniref:BnaC01g32540D protein n=1 Tax=Brassica napus TaxID=3708 RepID=A0A078GQG6_BRANA|nr:BnaC01g32540D [Brassica napus]
MKSQGFSSWAVYLKSANYLLIRSWVA